MVDCFSWASSSAPCPRMATRTRGRSSSRRITTARSQTSRAACSWPTVKPSTSMPRYCRRHSIILISLPNMFEYAVELLPCVVTSTCVFMFQCRALSNQLKLCVQERESLHKDLTAAQESVGGMKVCLASITQCNCHMLRAVWLSIYIS